MIMPTFTVMYTCARCRTVDRKVSVRARTSADDDLLAWMEEVKQAVGRDHSDWSPYCGSTTCDLKVPIPEGNFIGEATKQ